VDLFNHLAKFKLFMVVAREGSFHQAARTLRMAQPSLSQSIKNLEDVLGEQLLVRSHRGVEVTPAGRLVLELCHRVDRGLASLKTGLATHGAALGKHLRVGVHESAAVYIWPLATREIKAKLPELETTLATGRSAELMQDLRQGEIDAALVIEPTEAQGTIVKTLYSDHFACFVGRGEGSMRSRSAEPEEVQISAELPLILFYSAQVGPSQKLEELTAVRGIEKQHTLRVESFEVAKEFCRQGLGVAILPTRVAAQSVRDGNLRRAHVQEFGDREFGRHRFCYCYRPDHWEIGAIRTLEKLLRALAIQLDASVK
jgi:DNA-binding transcriptional LysR family regulator